MSLDTAHWNHRASGLKWVEEGASLRPVNVVGKAINYSHSTGSTWRDCARKAWFSKVAAAPQGVSEPADRGARIHALLEHRGKYGQWPDPDTFLVPMRERPARYQCDPTGKLHGTRHVYIADSANFSSLPSKNMSLGMMANAMRVADGVARGLAGA